MLVQWWGEDPDFTATSLAYRIKCESQGVETKTCNHVDAAPQARITTYTDGSVRHPQSIFSIATFGLFIPDCDPETIPKAMLDYTTVLDIGELPGKAGTALGGTLGGLFHSSARAELAGLATGLLAPTAVHIGLDNMGVTQKTATILDGTVSRRRPWSLQPDGDLWRFVDSIILQRGINSSSCDWIKGHVSLQMLDQGYPMRDAIYNSYADAAADAAHRISTMKVQHEILSFFAQKQ